MVYINTNAFLFITTSGCYFGDLSKVAEFCPLQTKSNNLSTPNILRYYLIFTTPETVQ